MASCPGLCVYALCYCFGYLLVLWSDPPERQAKRLLYLYLGVLAYGSGLDYYFHGRDGREIDLFDPRLLLVCLRFNIYLPSAANKELRSSHDEVLRRFT